MPRFFHQNMRVFGGGSADRNDQFIAAFNQVQAALGQGCWVAGFTEIVNSGLPCQDALNTLAQTFDRGLTLSTLVAVGTMAVSSQTEYLGIHWNSRRIAVQYAGVVLKDNFNQQWTAFPCAQAPGGGIPTVIGIPAGAETLNADSRGLAFVAGMAGGQPYVVGFIHNMFQLGDKSGAYDHIPAMANAIIEVLPGGYADARVVIGGDFNLSPRDPGSRRTNTSMYAVAAVDDNGAYVNTTQSNPYDYWLVNFGGVTAADSQILVQTRGDDGRSDHAGSLLNF